MINYREKSHFKYRQDVRYWRVAIHSVLERHKLVDISNERPYIRAFSGGQNPVFLVNGKWVVKFYYHRIAGEKVSDIEIGALRMISSLVPRNYSHTSSAPASCTLPSLPPPTTFAATTNSKFKLCAPCIFPTLIASGNLYEKGSPSLISEYGEKLWYWPYIVQTYVTGHAVDDLWEYMTREDKENAASYLGQVMRAINDLPFEQENMWSSSQNGTSDNWKQFRDFMKIQRKECSKEIKEGDLLPETVVENELEAYLPSDVGKLWRDGEKSLKFLHADMTDEHLLGSIRTGKWVPTGVIDFGDVRVGDLLYELIPIHIDVFKCDEALTKIFIESYGRECWQRKNIAYICMCYTILHEQDALRTVWDNKPEWQTCEGGLKELEQKIWGWVENL